MMGFRARFRRFQRYFGLVERHFAWIELAPKHQDAATYTDEK
jgi:hypothetical protein